MSTDWASWEGHAVREVFPLLRLLGSSERSGVFLSRAAAMPSSDVALKLVPAVRGQAELLLSRWRSAMVLDHPHLLRVFEVGECELGEQRYLYSVMEYAEQNLAQLLEHRALVPEEVRELLGPMLNALEFLHGSKRVHGALKPSNVLVVGEQVKLASDAIGPASDVASRGIASAGTLSPYLPPEAGSGVRLAAGDVWALGVTTCEALSRRRPAGLHAIGGSIALPPDIPPTFRDMISKCLSRRPEDRPDVARLQAWQTGGELESMPAPAPAPAQETSVSNVAEVTTSSAPIRLVIRAELASPDEITEPVELKAQWRPMRLIVAGVLLLAIVGGGVYFFGFRGTPAVNTAPLAASSGAANSQRPQVAAGDAPAPGAPPSRATPRAASAPASQPPSSDTRPSGAASQVPASRLASQAASGGASQTAPESASQPPTPVPSATDGTTPRPAPSDSSAATNEVIPVVPRSASQTIRGTVRVSVGVIVDAAGNVVAANSENPGPSRYFERLSLEAAKQWKFVPAERGSQRRMLVKFNYTRFGATAKASPVQ